GRDQGGFVREAQARFAEAVKLPPGYQVSWGGQFENFDRARQRLAIIIPITIGIIFLLLFVTFGSAFDAGLVLLNVPFSLAGGLVALYARDIHLSVSAAVGFISLFGVAVMSGVLYIADVKRRRLDLLVSTTEAVVEAARAQFRPILMLVLVAMFGMIPAALARGIGSDTPRTLLPGVGGGLGPAPPPTPLALPPGPRLAPRISQSSSAS